MKQRVLVVEDNRFTREGLCRHIERHAAFDVIEAEDYHSALALLEQPLDFLVLDLGLPDGDGLELIAPAVAINPQLLVLVLTVFGDEKRVISAIEAGAKGYLLKDRALDELAEVLLSMREGHSPIDHRIARVLLRMVSGKPRVVDFSESLGLSSGEQSVLTLIARGMSYKEIARERNISINTVREYIRRIYRKLQVTSRSQAVSLLRDEFDS
jgi:DNA-binding NarL/FixJ family response regulator